MRLLVDVERTNRGLNHQIDTGRAFEASLRDNISLLEAQLNASKADSSTGVHDFHLLMSEMRELKSSIRTIDKTTTQIAFKLSSVEPPPTPVKIRLPPTPTVTRPRTPLAAEPVRAPPSPELPRVPEQLRSPPQPKPSVLRKQSPRVGLLTISSPSIISLVEPQEVQSPGSGHQRTTSVSSPRQMASPSVTVTRIVSQPTPSATMPRQVMSPPTPTPQQVMTPPLTPGGRPLFGQSSPLFKHNTISHAGTRPNMEMPVPTVRSFIARKVGHVDDCFACRFPARAVQTLLSMALNNM
ncbi:hypothetical protein BDV93DRAFT_231018 [Ceratobasidium sp. AG-I]|nr:hypothetical protein BDV93DRAFT_231018 [Ceratobasidium sp. AG-I]